MSSTTSQSSSTFNFLFNREKKSAETKTKLDFISYIWDNYHILSLDKKTSNAYLVIKFSKESMLLRLLIMYLGRRVRTLKAVTFLRTKLI